jgi:lipopolysaccharide biosynthesis regulator YciM
MDSNVILGLLLFCALAAGIAITIRRKRPAPTASSAAADYADGLNLLLQGNKEAALRKLKESVAKNSQNLDAYLKIGDILRELGQAERAMNVHRYLTVRKGLSGRQRQDILLSLSEDYISVKEFDKALEVVNKALLEDKNSRWAQAQKIRLFELKDDWDNAFRAYKETRKNDPAFKTTRLALYRVEDGLKYQKSGKVKEAKVCLKEAIKIDPHCPPAYIELADVYRKEGRRGEALRTFKEFVERVPEQSYLAFGQIKELLYEGGVYGEIENLYLDIIHKQPGSMQARLALAENYEKKGAHDAAIRACLEVLEKDPQNTSAQKYLVQLYHHAGRYQDAVNMALDLIDATPDKKDSFSCHQCGHESKHLFWHCPECGTWETAKRS